MRKRIGHCRLPALALALVALAWPSARGQPRDDEPEISIRIVFFPPPAPVYGDKIAERARQTRFRLGYMKMVAPEDMADYAGDLLYPSLSTRRFGKTMSATMDAKVSAYANHRNAILTTLLNEFVTLHDASDDGAEREFRNLALTQSPAIVALENEADALRDELTRNRFGFDAGWNSGRKWRLDSFTGKQDWLNSEAEFQVARASAYYDDGLTPVQRGLMRELAIELEIVARKTRGGEPANTAESDAMFFSPETSRIRLPPQLPKEVLERVARYNQFKAELKKELRETLHQVEGAWRSERGAAFAKLAEAQWPRLAKLEEMADELRGDLAAAFVITPPEKLPPIPGFMVDVIQSYNDDRDSYFGEMQAAIHYAVAAIPRPVMEAGADRAAAGDEYATMRKEAERDAVTNFQRANVERYAALEKRYKGIKEALESIASSITDPKTGKHPNVEGLLRQHMAAMAEFDRFGRASASYTHYRAAMFQRGLSPEQRRLLFSYAIVSLAQPLPFGEPVPRRGDKYPFPH